MNWKWRGEYCKIENSIVLDIIVFTVPASRNEYQSIRVQLESESFPGYTSSDPPRNFHQLTAPEQASMEKKRLSGVVNIKSRYNCHDIL